MKEIDERAAIVADLRALVAREPHPTLRRLLSFLADRYERGMHLLEQAHPVRRSRGL